MKIKTILATMLLLAVMILPMFVGVEKTAAAVVNTSLSIPYKETDDWQQFNGLGTKNMYVNNNSGYININLYKVFNFLKNDGSILTLDSTLDIGKSINSNISNTEGNYSVNSKSFNINQGALFTGKNCWTNTCHYWKRIMEVFNPVESDGVKVTSTNPSVVECVNNICTSKSPGVANIVVDFPKKTQTGVTSGSVSVYEKQWGGALELVSYNVKTYGNTYYGSDYGYGNIMIGGYGQRSGNGNIKDTNNLKNATYSFPSITYTVTVPGTPNTPQVSTCTEATNITKDSATVNWSYTDVDPLDVQTQYQVQLSTKSYIDPTFTNADIVFASSSASSVTNHTFTGLTSNTTYYARIKTQNAVNGWSTVYSTCNTGFKTLTDDSSQPTCSCNGTRDYTCKKTDGTVVSTEVNSSQCTFGSACTVEKTPTDTTFTIIPLNGLGSITYSHGTISKTLTNIERYYYPTPTLNTVQSLTVNLLDNLDGKTSTAKCSIDNTKIVCNGDHNEGDITCPIGTQVKWSCDAATGTWKSTDTSKTCTPTPTTPTIKITKKPAITLNKGGKCTLDWTITDRPTDMVCTLIGTGVTTPIPLSNQNPGTWTSPELYQNTKYTISCTGGTPLTTISASAICRINPSVNEI